METASYATLYALNAPRKNRFRLCNVCTSIGFSDSRIAHRHSRNFPRLSRNVSENRRLLDGFVVTLAKCHAGSLSSSPDFAILLEVDGVLMDIHRLTNRQCFNLAFRKLGLDCANWTEPVYLDLLRRSGGEEEKMLTLYFNQIGWPTSLPTSEKDSFVKSVQREKKTALKEIVTSESVTLRPGVQEFIDDAYDDGIPVVVLIAYGKQEETIARSIVEKIGQERLSKVKIVGKQEVEQSLYGKIITKSLLAGSDEEIAKEALKAVSAEKQRVAEEVASLLKLKVELGTNSSESLERIVPALRAGAEYAGATVDKCLLIAGSQMGVAACERIGMPCIVLRSSVTARAEFPSAKAVLDGFGGADLTISRLRTKF